MVWGLLAVVSWLAVLVPAYLLVDNGPELVEAVFGDDTDLPANAVARPDDSDLLTPAQIEALGRLAPAAGGQDDSSPIRPVRGID